MSKANSRCVYYHNPRCSKSRQGLDLLNKQNFDFEIKDYLKTSFKKKELSELFKKLGKDPLEIVRTKEKIFKDLDLKNKSLTKAQWIDILIEHPVLLERPILSLKNKAIVGRPPEDLLKIIK